MTPKDYLGNIPKVGNVIAVILNTSTRHSVLARASVTGFKETPKQIKMFIKPINNEYLYRSYLILLDNKNSNQFIIIKCGKCGEFVHNGMTCFNPKCGTNPVYTSKEMVHGLLSIRSKRRMLK